MRTMQKLLGQMMCMLLILLSAGAAKAQSATAREVRPVSVIGNLIDVTRANDQFVNTRANAGTRNYMGFNVTLDIGGLQNVTGVIQKHGRWPTNYPGAYKVEVSQTADGPWIKTFEGPGSRGESRAMFDAVRGRYVRITATDTRGGGADDWSIAELGVIIDPAANVRIPPRDREPQVPGELIGDRGIRDVAMAFDRNPATRATTNTSDYAGAFFTYDLKGEYELSRVVQAHGEWRDDYPAEYKIEVSRDGRRYREVWRGEGQPGRSVAEFNPVVARYVRFTALRSRDRYHWWSIAELRTNRDQDSTPDEGQRPTPVESPSNRGMRDVALAFDRNPATRATSGSSDYAGASFTFDLNGEYELSRIVQVHGEWRDDYPGEYRVEVSRSRDEQRFREVFRGAGEPGRSVAQFNPVITRYVRITALRNRDRYHWWSIAELRTNRDPDVVERDEDDSLTQRVIRRINSRGLSNAEAVGDENNTTRATTGTANYAGSWIVADLGGSYTISKVVQVHNPDERDHAGRYRIEVSTDGSRWQSVWQGQGERGRSVATFTPVRARYVRITAISNYALQRPWSIYKLRIRG